MFLFHRAVHVSNMPLVFQCSKCPDTFDQEALLDRHYTEIHRHTKKRRAERCDLCNVAVMYDKALQRHKDVYHPQKFQCLIDDCTASFHNLTSMRSHVWAEHLDSVVGSAPPPTGSDDDGVTSNGGQEWRKNIEASRQRLLIQQRNAPAADTDADKAVVATSSATLCSTAVAETTNATAICGSASNTSTTANVTDGTELHSKPPTNLNATTLTSEQDLMTKQSSKNNEPLVPTSENTSSASQLPSCEVPLDTTRNNSTTLLQGSKPAAVQLPAELPSPSVQSGQSDVIFPGQLNPAYGSGFSATAATAAAAAAAVSHCFPFSLYACHMQSYADAHGVQDLLNPYGYPSVIGTLASSQNSYTTAMNMSYTTHPHSAYGVYNGLPTAAAAPIDARFYGQAPLTTSSAAETTSGSEMTSQTATQPAANASTTKTNASPTKWHTPLAAQEKSVKPMSSTSVDGNSQTAAPSQQVDQMPALVDITDVSQVNSAGVESQQPTENTTSGSVQAVVDQALTKVTDDFSCPHCGFCFQLSNFPINRFDYFCLLLC